MSQRIAICRSCGARGVWCKTISGSNILVELPGITPAEMRQRSPITFNGEKTGGTHVAHFAKCPEADQWRKKR